jgi:hypothetical protein
VDGELIAIFIGEKIIFETRNLARFEPGSSIHQANAMTTVPVVSF